MFWPKDKKRYENLKSSFTNLKLFIEDLYNSHFNGFLLVRFEDQAYYVLLEQGYPERVYIEDSEGKYLFNEGLTADEIHNMSLGEQATIDVYDVDPERIDMLVGYLRAAPLYTNLSSEFTDFERLTNKLSKDGFNGYLEIKFLNPSLEPFYLLYEHGDIKDVFHGGKPVGKNDASIRDIRLQLEKNEAYFNAFQSSKTKMEEVSPDSLGENREPGNGDGKEESVLGNSVGMEKIVTEVELETETTKDTEGKEGKEEIEVLEEELEEIDLEPRIEERIQKENGKFRIEQIKSEFEQMEEEEIEAHANNIEDLVITPYLGFVEALIQWVEKSVNRHMGENYFSKAFKKGMLNISDKYPFLDPFLAEFTYVDGKINFSNEDTKAVEFLKGIYAAIDMIFEELTTKKRGEIAKTLKYNLRDLEKKFHEEIEILRVRTLMPTLFQ